MRYLLMLLMGLMTFGLANAQEISGEELLDRALAFHNPSGRWEKAELQLTIDMETPGRPVRRSQLTIDNEASTFYIKILNRGNLSEFWVDANDSTRALYNFMAPTDSIQADSLNLTPERALRWRNYYSYLYGLPMKLNDPGTKIDPVVQRTQFLNQEVLALKATYDAEVGSDIWYFYFHPETYAMVGYRFYHDEAANDGEYIVLEGLEIKNGIRIPKNRTWYTNAEDRLLGTDYLIDLKVK
ncbi:DUF6503 family protein [Roseivirga sp.]|uniref:DUF6503 family protein n=1 Tax=Roseivirga sp. TaxID=1964215 RepID=UPI003B51DD41